MPTYFNGATYELYVYKGQNGDSPMQPISPQNEIGASPKNEASLARSGALITMGITVAKRTIDTVRNEIGASTGNEALQTDINNAMKAIGYGAAIAAGGIAGAVLVGADVALNAITYSRELTRQNRKLTIERELQGNRSMLATGSAYYD